MGYNIGPKIGIEGEPEFRRQIREINQSYKTLEAETKAVTAEFDKNDDAQGKLKATAALLHKQIDAQRQKMKLLEEAVHKAADKYGENSIEANRLKGVLYDTRGTVAGLEKKLRDTEQQLDDSGGAMQDFAEETDDAGKKVITFGNIVSANIVADVIRDKLRSAAGMIKDFAMGSVSAAQDVSAANSQFSQTFGDLKDRASSDLQTLADNVKISATRMQGSYSMIYAFSKNAGANSAEALNISSRAMVAAADSAAYYDKSMDNALETLQSFLKGNYENDAALGISATETTRNAAANRIYAKSFKELSESQKVDVLLAMVEAGNEASGAIGQAARESDSWSNVNGELTEMLRQLQAEAGRPALQKLVPVIKNITKAGYELIEDVDWDWFADKVSDIADGVIDAAPDIIRAIAAIAAGLAAMKIVQKIQELSAFTTQLINAGAAAKTAGEAIAAGGAIATGPWGLAAAAIATVATTIMLAVTDSESAVKDLEKSMDDFADSMDYANSKYKENAKEIEASAFAADYYVKRLKELEAAGLKTAEAQEEYRITVDQLNEVLPELNLTIDEQTGLLNQDTDAIEANIDAWKKQATQKALQEKFTDVLKARGKAEANLIEARAKLSIQEKETQELEQQRATVYEELQKAQQTCADAQTAMNNAMANGGEAYADSHHVWEQAKADAAELADRHNRLTQQIEVNKSKEYELKGAISEAGVTVTSYAEQIKLAEESINGFSQGTSDAAAKQTDLQLNVQQVQSQLDELNSAYDAACAEARESVDSQIGLFDELAEQSDWSAAKIIENWEKQQSAFANYEANLKKATELGLDKTLVKQLSDGSQQSMAILDALVNDTGISVDEINKAFAKTEESKNKLSTVMGDIKTDYTQKLDEMEGHAESAGINIVNGLANGVKNNSWQFKKQMRIMAESGQYSFNEQMKIRSPSRVMEKSGQYIVEGSVKGIDERISSFQSSMDRLASAGLNAYEEKINHAMQYPELVSSVNQTSVSRVIRHEYGDITIPVYAQPGESAEDIAYRVKDIIQRDIDIEGASF